VKRGETKPHPEPAAPKPPPAEPPAASPVRPWRVLALLAALTLACYANAIPNGFVFDDVLVIPGDARITQGQIGKILTEPYWPEIAFSDRLYRPLVSLSYAANWAVSQQAWAFRIPNLLIHVVVCWLVFELTRSIFRSRTGALLAAILFAIHPIHTEPLNTIVGRADLLGTAFGLAALLLWWRDAEPGAGVARFRPVAAALLFAAALLCKESGITCVGVLAVLEWWRWQRRERPPTAWFVQRLLRCYAPAAAVVVVYLAVRLSVLDQLTSEQAVPRHDNPIATPVSPERPLDIPPLIRWGTPLYTYGKAAGMMFWPQPLVHDYSYPAIREVARAGDPRLWYGLGWVALTVGVAVVSWRRRRIALVALAFAVIPYSIVSNFVVLIGTIFGERLLYTPSVGFCMAVGLALAGVVGRARWVAALERWIAGESGVDASADTGAERGAALAGPVSIALAVVVAGCVVLNGRRNPDWRDAEALILSVPDDEHASFKVLDAYADRAIRDGERLRQQGHEQAAVALFEKALDYGFRARDGAPDAWGPYRAIGRAQLRLGNADKALFNFIKAMPMGAGWDLDVLKETLSLLYPRQEWCNICLVYDTLVIREPTWQHFNDFADARMRCPRPLTNKEGQPLPGSVELARQALAMNPGACAVYHTLAMAYGAAGRRAEAVQTIQEGLARCAPDDPHRGELQALAAQFNP
jgi:tetratricopeptide (TPR) repeat protein